LMRQHGPEVARIQGNEAAMSRWFTRRAFAYMRSHPGETLFDDLRKDLAAFSILPSPRRSLGATLVYALSYGPVMLLGLWGMWRRRAQWRDDLPVYLLFMTFITTTALFWAHTSHRVYLDVYWIVFAAGAVAETACVRRSWNAGESVQPLA